MRSLTALIIALVLTVAASLAQAETSKLPSHCGLYAYAAQVTEVYDGDSITADVDLGFNTWRRGEKLRLWGIDAPEVRGDSRPAGLVSRDALRERILGMDVIICTVKDRTEKYCRYLAEIYLDGENINEWLIESNLAAAYDGGKRAALVDLRALFPKRFQYAPLE